jgi:hypothetical protein
MNKHTNKKDFAVSRLNNNQHSKSAKIEKPKKKVPHIIGALTPLVKLHRKAQTKSRQDRTN